jgi:beta-xylosidase
MSTLELLKRLNIRTFNVWALVAALLLTACGGSQPAGTTASAPTPAPAATQQVAPTAAPAPTRAGPTAVPTPGPGQYANPVINQDFPDPDSLKVGDTYYAYATNFGSQNIQAAKSTDLVSWTALGDALPFLPDWAQPGFTWAPEVTIAADHKSFVMYFVARDKASDKQCIGVATSDKPEGSFASDSPKPLICQTDQGGSIDPTAFADEDGKRYVLWKNDGNCCGQDTWLYIQPVSASGLALEGQPTKLIKQDQAWEGNLIAAPTLWKHGGKYYLFYSANNYAGADYAVGYAVASSPLGPYQKVPGPFLKTSTAKGPVLGPGGQDIVVAPDGETWLLYHSWDPSITYRSLNIDKLTWSGDTPAVTPAYRLPEPMPK